MEENKMKTKEKLIEEAKTIAKKDYENLMKKCNAFNPKYPRKWIERKQENGTSFALEGTPDKAFVFVFENKRTIVATRPNGSVIKKFKY